MMELSLLPEPAVVELVALIGFYHAVSVLLNSYQVEIPDIPGPKPMEV